MKTGLVQLIQEEKHSAWFGHPENAGRIKPALEYIQSSDIARYIENITPEPADSDIVFSVHDRAYLERVKSISSDGGGYLDGDTYVTNMSYEAALETASAVISSVDSIMSNNFNRIFLAIRPPGHHAEYDRGMGFCLINNIAVAAQALVMNHGLKRIAIVDWDVHHGNGTQNIFYNRADVYYFSLHQYPFYPDTGSVSETGQGAGMGYTLNIPLAAGCDDNLYLEKFSEIIIPELRKYQPEFILISAGFDGHRDDPLAGFNLTESTYAEMTRLLAGIANKYCKGRILSVLEGGYNASAVSISLYNHLKELDGN